MAKILIPTALQQYAGGTDELEAPGRTVQEVLDNLSARYPALAKQLRNDRGELRHFVNVYKGAGGLSGVDQEILYCVITRLEVGRVKAIVRAVDDTAFVVSHPLADVDGGVVKRALVH